MMNERRRDGLARQIAKMTTFQDLAGKTVLEIGADKDGLAANMLVDAGAKRVISTNYGEKWPEETKDPIVTKRLDARRMEDVLEAQSVDVIFGMAILEHIDGLPAFFAGAKHVLKPSGLFFVHGGPLWSYARGHHLYIDVEDRKYRFSSKDMNPIDDWTHLIHTKESLTAALTEKNLPPGDAEKIAEWVYDDPRINRVGFRDMCDMFNVSGLQLEERLINAWDPPPPELLAAIRSGPYRGQRRYDVSGVTFAGRA